MPSISEYDCCTSNKMEHKLVEQELLTLPEHMSSPPVFSEIHVARPLVLCVLFCRSLFVLFLLFIVLSVLLRFTDSDYPLITLNSSYRQHRWYLSVYRCWKLSMICKLFWICLKFSNHILILSLCFVYVYLFDKSTDGTIQKQYHNPDRQNNSCPRIIK